MVVRRFSTPQTKATRRLCDEDLFAPDVFSARIFPRAMSGAAWDWPTKTTLRFGTTRPFLISSSEPHTWIGLAGALLFLVQGPRVAYALDTYGA